jgi:NitT/TauT family transport system substrate-binding protein
MSARPLKIRFALNTFYSGPQAWFFLADDLGFFREEGLEVHFTPGDTAANVIPKLAKGDLGFDVGYGDSNALIEWQAMHGVSCAQIVFALHNASPYTIAVPANLKLTHLAKLQGTRLASHPNDAALNLLPELAQCCAMSAADFAIELCTEPHAEMIQAMLRQARWSGIFGFVNTLKAAAIERGIDPDTELQFFQYRDWMPSLYGAALMVTPHFIREHGDRVTGLVRAVNRGLHACIANLDAAIDAVARRDPSIDRAANRARLAGTLSLEMAHPDGGDDGIGPMRRARLEQSIALIVQAKHAPHRPTPETIYTAAYLPARDQRVDTLV